MHKKPAPHTPQVHTFSWSDTRFFISLSALLVLAVAVLVFLPWSLKAQSAISQSYDVDEILPIGFIVSLEDGSSDRVEPATIGNVNSILGVVVNESNSMIKLSSGEDNQVPVATSGSFGVLVSDMNGPIERGDHITASPIPGVGMKATSNARVVGIAQGELREEGGRNETYEDADGNEQSVLLGEVTVMVNIAYYFSEPERTIIPSTVQNISNAIAGRPVEPLPIIISGVVFVVTMIAVASIIFSMIRSSIISVGRNPMSQSAVYRNVLQLTALVLGILTVAAVSIYLVLTRF